MADGADRADKQSSIPARERASALRLIDGHKRISQSVLWETQKQFYLKQGVRWWTERPVFAAAEIPFCDALADLVAAVLTDRLSDIDQTKPIYIIELGTGSGCSSYRFALALKRKLRSSSLLRSLKIRYILTDIIAEIVPLWVKNQQLKPLIDEGLIDCAVFDPSNDQSIVTAVQGETICAESFANMPIFVANSLFDTICVDGFRIEDGTVREATVNLSVPEQSSVEEALIADSIVMELEFGNVVGFPYYEDPQIDRILHEYRDEFPKASITIPIGALRIIANLRRWSGDRMTLFVHSRGYSSKELVETSDGLSYNDLSFPLNFHALRRYFELSRGTMLMREQARLHHSLAIGAIVSGQDSSALPQTASIFPNLIDSLDSAKSARDKEVFHPENQSATSVQSLINMMRDCHCDPTLYAEILMDSLDALEREIPDLAQSQVLELRKILANVNENIYAFGRDLPPVNLDDEPLAVLIKVWQRAQAAWKTWPTPSALAGFSSHK